jgi:GntR family transcriptional regulator
MAMYSNTYVSVASHTDTLLCMDVPDLDHGSHVPLYIQGADWITAQVKAGKLAPGTRLPAERDLAEQWGIAYMTVRRMMAELRERGVVVSQPGKGTYVL